MGSVVIQQITLKVYFVDLKLTDKKILTSIMSSESNRNAATKRKKKHKNELNHPHTHGSVHVCTPTTHTHQTAYTSRKRKHSRETFALARYSTYSIRPAIVSIKLSILGNKGRKLITKEYILEYKFVYMCLIKLKCTYFVISKIMCFWTVIDS